MASFKRASAFHLTDEALFFKQLAVLLPAAVHSWPGALIQLSRSSHLVRHFWPSMEWMGWESRFNSRLTSPESGPWLLRHLAPLALALVLLSPQHEVRPAMVQVPRCSLRDRSSLV